MTKHRKLWKPIWFKGEKLHEKIQMVLYKGKDSYFHIGYLIEVKNVVVVCDSFEKAEQLLNDSTEIEKMILNLNEE